MEIEDSAVSEVRKEGESMEDGPTNSTILASSTSLTTTLALPSPFIGSTMGIAPVFHNRKGEIGLFAGERMDVVYSTQSADAEVDHRFIFE